VPRGTVEERVRAALGQVDPRDVRAASAVPAGVREALDRPARGASGPAARGQRRRT
jgi:hypothetical protein